MCLVYGWAPESMGDDGGRRLAYWLAMFILLATLVPVLVVCLAIFMDRLYG